MTTKDRNRPLYQLFSGFAKGQALGCHAVARADRIQKSMQKHCRDTENDQSVVLNRRLPVSTFSPTIGLDAATSSPLTGLRSIVLPLELNVHVRLRRRSSCPVGRRDKFAKSLRKQESRPRYTRNARKKWSVYLPPRM